MTAERSTLRQEFCPNYKRHADEGSRWTKGIADYKRSQISASFREGFRSDQATCDWCRPPCPTCGHREPREGATGGVVITRD